MYSAGLLLLQVYEEVDRAADSRQFATVHTPVETYNTVSAECHILEYTRLPISDDAAPSETVTTMLHFCCRASQHDFFHGF